MFKPITKPSVMARFFIQKEGYSEYGHIGVNFNIVGEADGRTVPTFLNYEYELPKMLQGINNLMVNSQTSESSLNDTKHDRIYGYGIHLDMTKPQINLELLTAIKAGERIKKKVSALRDKEGCVYTYSAYLAYVMRAMNVKYITHESYSSNTSAGKWKNYKISEIPQIVNNCAQELSALAGWNLEATEVN